MNSAKVELLNEFFKNQKDSRLEDTKKFRIYKTRDMKRIVPTGKEEEWTKNSTCEYFEYFELWSTGYPNGIHIEETFKNYSPYIEDYLIEKQFA